MVTDAAQCRSFNHLLLRGVVQDQPAWQYMHYIEKLTDGLPRVLLVHGCGNEVVTAIE